MSKTIQCFMLEPQPRIRRSLRRYVSSGEGDAKCPFPHGYHNARLPLDEVDFPALESMRVADDGVPHDDPRWPAQCACGYVFKDDDRWQVFPDRIYRRVDTGELLLLEEAPPGAMYDAHWNHGIKDWVGPDGQSLQVKLPPGRAHDWWHIDGFAKGGGKWTRTGTAPRISVTPSILTPDYHGFLTDGELREC